MTKWMLATAVKYKDFDTLENAYDCWGSVFSSLQKIKLFQALAKWIFCLGLKIFFQKLKFWIFHTLPVNRSFSIEREGKNVLWSCRRCWRTFFLFIAVKMCPYNTSKAFMYPRTHFVVQGLWPKKGHQIS